jgi:hypothetical protein
VRQCARGQPVAQRREVALQRSSELTSVVESIYNALSTGDADTVAGLLTTGDGLTFIGTDPTEWYTDRESVLTLVRSQSGAGVKVRAGDIQAFEEGTVGWVADKGTFILPDGTEVPFRLTAVFRQEDGGWRMVQEHASIAVDNEEVIGTEL